MNPFLFLCSLAFVIACQCPLWLVITAILLVTSSWLITNNRNRNGGSKR